MKKERGAITLITLVTILLMIAFLISTFTIIMNRRQAQAEIKKETQEIYESDVEDVEQVYQSYFAGEDETIPILNTDNLLKVCKIIQEDTDGYIFAKDKIYKCTASSNYKLEANLALNDADYIDKYPELFGEKSWVETTETEVTKTLTNQVTNFGTVGSSTYKAPATGTYTLQVWGAQGGSYSTTYYGGKGGYSVGTISLSQEDKLYVNVGGRGTSVTSATIGGTGGSNGGRKRRKWFKLIKRYSRIWWRRSD